MDGVWLGGFSNAFYELRLRSRLGIRLVARLRLGIRDLVRGDDAGSAVGVGLRDRVGLPLQLRFVLAGIEEIDAAFIFIRADVINGGLEWLHGGGGGHGGRLAAGDLTFIILLLLYSYILYLLVSFAKAKEYRRHQT